MDIIKKCWPELFQRVLDGKKTADARLADFNLKEGDMLILEEFNPQTKKYTGRTIKKKVKNLTKLNLADYNSIEEIKKYGHWLIEFE